MRYNTYINTVKCMEWGLNANQGALFDLLNQLSSWAKESIVGDAVFYHISRNKVIEELPLFYSKPDTVYRNLKKLEDIGLVEYLKEGKKDLVKLTEKGKEWNSEINPNLGNESEKPRNEIRKNSDLNPTYNITSNNNTNNNKKEKSVLTVDDLKPRDADDRVPVTFWGATWEEFQEGCPKEFIDTAKVMFPDQSFNWFDAKEALKLFYNQNATSRSMFPKWKWRDILIKNLNSQKRK